METVAPILPGETLAGKYRIERVLGRGGMGIVMAARHLDLDQRVAIKFLLGEHADDGAERFLREGRASAKVKGEHVCRVFDFGRLESGEPYIVMDYLEGQDLARKLEREGPQDVSRVVGWMIEACDALAVAHAMGIIHRDLKPANVFLAERADGSSCAKILDFGISKLGRAETMTGPAITMGSPAYMSPEQMESARDVDARSDVWSLGVMMYQLVSGRPPFIGDSMVQLSVLVRERREEPLELLVPGVPKGLARVITCCLEKKPDDRFATIADLAAALAPYAPQEVSSLVARLARRRTSEPAIALARTSLDHDRQTPLPRDRTETSQAIQGPGERATFAPVQSSVAQRASIPPPRRRWSTSTTIATAIALSVGLFAAGSLRVTAQPAQASAAPAVTPKHEETSFIAPALPPISRMDTAPVRVAPTNAVQAAAPKAAPRPKVTAPVASAASAPSSVATPVVSATASVSGMTVAPRTKRELDRDDP